MRALILCAGLGSRLGLKKTPKCMVKVSGKPILEHIVNRLNKVGVNEIIVNIHKNGDKVMDYFGTRLLYLYEPTLLGEAGTQYILRNWLGDEYFVINGDTLTNLDLEKFMLLEGSAKYMDTMSGHYAGTMLVRKNHAMKLYVPEFGTYHFDCGTPEKLAKARKFFKNAT
jgi:NDP-sugar pyrophosphorylase family protein